MITIKRYKEDDNKGPITEKVVEPEIEVKVENKPKTKKRRTKKDV